MLNTVSYPVLNLCNALDLQAKTRDTDEYREFAAKQDVQRYKQIFRDRPYQSMFPT